MTLFHLIALPVRVSALTLAPWRPIHSHRPFKCPEPTPQGIVYPPADLGISVSQTTPVNVFGVQQEDSVNCSRSLRKG